METETLSNYEQNREKHLASTMDVDIANNEEESVSPVNKTYEESTESTDLQDKADRKDTENEINKEDNTKRINIDSDEDCEEEEEEEKLLLSPAHSDKAYDSDDALSPELNRDLLESDNEVENEEIDQRIEKNIDEQGNSDNKNVSESSPEKNEAKEELDASDKKQEKNNAEEIENIQDTEDDSKNKEITDIGITEEISLKSDEKKDEALEKLEEIIQENQDSIDKKEIEDKIIKETEKDKGGKENKQDLTDSDGNCKEQTVKSADKESLNTKDKDNLQDKEDKEVSDKISENDQKEDKNDVPSDEISKVSEENEKENKHDVPSDENSKVSEENDKNDVPFDSNTKTKIKSNEDDKTEEKKDVIIIDNEKEEKNEHTDYEKNSLLKETLTKPLTEDAAKDSEMDEEMDMDEDFDPSLLCPELSMEVDEAPVITTNDGPAPETDGNKSPLHLYDPIFSTFVDEMTGAEVDFNLTAEELDLKAKTYGPKNPIQFTKIHCTACNIHLGSALDGQGNRFVHPLLKVLICKKCYHFYTSGEFEKDEDGSELYCRWCGQGGQVMCCSNCEMVFCKKCIRINFDRRKLMDIQKSDDWMCFRCNPSQLIHLRIHCAEFMEYVQSELRRAGSSGNVNAFMNTDYCQCCIPQKKKAPEPANTEPKSKKRKRVGEEDPDYNPTLEAEPVVMPSTPSTSQQTPTVTPKVIPTPQPRPTVVRPTTPGAPRPRVQVMSPSNVRPPAPGFVRIMPGGLRVAGPTTTANTATRPPALRPIRPSSTMKHEWFEKTVRAAARVNSNLSYTLTQLNRAQANATSVEALAVVHNKLQEILSSSINSLIQIRKNLRTEFIAGIKNIRFPPKTQPTTAPQPTTSKDDDDVIFVPSDPTPPPPPLVPVRAVTPNNKITLPPSITLHKKSPTVAPTAPTPSTSIIKQDSGGIAKKSTSTVDENKPKGFLRVKSFSALQSVTSECITIPDDPIEDEKSREVEIIKEKDPLDVSDEVANMNNIDSDTNGMTNGDCEIPLTINTLEDEGVIKKLKPAQIILQRSDEIDELVKTKFGFVNGSNSD